MYKVLVMEDDADVLFITTQILEKEGFEVLSADNGKSGLEIATSQFVDLIIADVMMPEMDGYQVLTELRNNLETAITPFIFLTAKSAQNDFRQGMGLGANDYLTKPFTREDLLQAVNARLNQHAKMMQHYFSKNREYQQLNKQVQNLRSFNQTKDEIFNKFALDLRQTMTKINIALKTIQNLPAGDTRDRHLEILQAECQQDIKLLNEVEDIYKFLTPENVGFLQSYNLLRK
jgi:DNA-binding response OmpR family regulator